MSALAPLFMLMTMTPQDESVKSVSSITLDDLIWENHAMLVFVSDESLQQQYLGKLQAGGAAINKRHVRYFLINGETVISNGADTFDPDYLQCLKQRFDPHPEQSRVVLIGQDGTVKYRVDNSLPLDKMVSLIDAMPVRQQAMDAAH